ncbi:unnamed protein product [Bursaphelenchus xylophilus]|uniref:(pine wood nematode) hypothetical protein n=1 Tax=Bursaphelenchus xylophilus TaxID=6326 RepID=A0A1I7SAJ9_BURXY|nr:unnamed protein product [Bursaphelenchus xylophilus]CAG9079301.1 unnamed protein product [Bursaphelenchus xylophilus]
MWPIPNMFAKLKQNLSVIHITLGYPILLSWLAGILFTVAHNARSYDVIYTYDLVKVGWVSRAKFGLAEDILLAVKISLMTVGLICTGILMRRILR